MTKRHVRRRRRDPTPNEATSWNPMTFLVGKDSRGRTCLRGRREWIVLELEGRIAHDAVAELCFIALGAAPALDAIRVLYANPETIACDVARIDEAVTLDELVPPPAGLVAYLKKRARSRAKAAE